MKQEPAKRLQASNPADQSTLDDILRRLSEIEKTAQAFAEAGMEMPPGTEDEYLALKAKIKQLQN
jgi:hypothetical protein